MNDKGDFVMYNPSTEDVYENQGNLLVNMTLMRELKRTIFYRKMYSNQSNYYWDDED